MEATILLVWLRKKAAEEEASFSARMEMAGVAERASDPRFFDELAKLPGTIVVTSRRRYKGRATTEENKALAESHRRIAQKHRREVEMFRAVIAVVEKEGAK